jgi:aminocarboxymuconate-semialdehyde decarboxylase
MKSSRRNFIRTGALAVAATAAAGGNQAAAQTGTAPATQSFAGTNNYASTFKPKAWTLPQRPTPPISIDIHTHWAPAAYLKAKADLGRPDFLPPSNYDLENRKKWMDTHGVQTIMMTLGGFRPWQWVTPAQGAMISRVSNDAAMEAHKAYPARFVAGIELNCSDPVGALAELNRVAGKPGMVCVHLPTSLAERDFLFEPAFQPVLARTEELGLPILLHPLDGEANWFGGKRLIDEASGLPAGSDLSAPANRFPGLTNSLGNTLEISVAMSKLIASGTLDKYPKLTFIATCGGGAFPYAAGRMDWRGSARLKRPYYEYLRQFYYDSLVFSPMALRFLAEVVGSDRIMLGTDNMFQSETNGIEQPHAIIDQAGLSEADRDLILRGNAKRLLKI